MISGSLSVALKEWDVVCHALATGRQCVLLRKGGIHESSSGFELEHEQFLLYPTFVHQNPAMLKAESQKDVRPHATEPEKITISAAAEVTDILRLQYREQMDVLDAEHIWTSPLIDMRFNYKPQNPLYLLILRTYKLAQPVTIDNTPAYAGCKSWVPLEQAVQTAQISPALGDDEFKRRSRAIIDRLSV